MERIGLIKMNEQLQKNGFKIVRNIYEIGDLYEYVKNLEDLSTDNQSPGCSAWYNELRMCQIHIDLLPIMEKETGLRLYPTYTYGRKYYSDSVLKAHKDRPPCEISLTLTIGYEGDYNWPVWIKDNMGVDHKIILEPGDGLIYLGHHNEHWRDDADERVKFHAQEFFHYVNADGPFKDYIFDCKK